MEDDDEFGDLYADVLLPFQSSSSSHQPPAQSELPSPGLPIDLNVKGDDEEIPSGAHSNPKFTSTGSQQSQTQVSTAVGRVPELGLSAATSESRWNLNLGGKQNDEVAKKEDASAGGTSSRGSDLPKATVSRVFGSGGDVKVQGGGFEDPNLIDESMIDVAVVERDHTDGNSIKNENFEKFDIEEDDNVVGSQPEIPGLSVYGASNAANTNFAVRENATEGDDWDSDSEDDLQIVLNDNNHGPTAMEGAGASDDEDGDPLVILGDTEPGHQPRVDQDWGDNTAQAMDGDRKELGDAARGPGGLVVAPTTGYPSHPYHPYHSQFKYVRPGAPPMPGVPPAGPAGALGQVHPPAVMGSVAGRGRGEWRPMQKNFHSGYGQPAWGNNSAGRGFGSGLDFTLPSHKTIFEVDVDGFEDKPWRHPGVDISEFFNFGLAEESWKDYCKQLEQLRLEASMQSKIRVYESGRTEQNYDPDLPPELAAAAAMHDTSENANLRKIEAGSSDLVDGSTVRPPLPTGRPIQVEISSVERFPSIDTRPQRMRDADSVIEIVLQDSADDSCPGNDVKEQPVNDHSRVASRGVQKIDGDTTEENISCSDGSPSAYNDASNKRSLGSGRQTPTFPGRGIGTLHPRRWTKGGTNDRSPNRTPSGSTPDGGFPDNRDDVSVKRNGEQGRSRLTSLATVKSDEPGSDHGDGLRDELVLDDESSGMEKEEMALDSTTGDDDRRDENHLVSVRRQAVSSRNDQSSLHEVDDGGYKATSSENSKGRSGSSKGYQRMRDSAGEEVVQHGHSTRVGNLRRQHDNNQTVKSNGDDERHRTEKHNVVEKDREGSYSRRDRDRHMAHHPLVRADVIDRRIEKEFPEGAWQRRDDDSHGRRAIAEGSRKQEYMDEVGSRYWDKIRENEKINKDESLQLRKQMDNGYSRGYQDKDVGSRFREREDGMKPRYENMDDLQSKRRKEGDRVRRDAEKDDILHGHRENTSRHKRERDEAFDMRKRDDHLRIKDDDHHSIQHKEDWIHRERGERQRERDEWNRLKHSQEESSTLKRERQEGRVGVRSSRPREDKAWASHARMKDEYRNSSDRDYQFKDTGRHIEHSKRRDRGEVGHLSHLRGREDQHLRGNQLGDDDRRSRQEKASGQNDHAIGGSDDNRVHDRKHKEKAKKGKDSEGGSKNSMGNSSKRNQEDRSSQMNEPVGLKGSREHKNSEHEIPVNRHSSRKRTEDASSEDELQNAGRGRSKLERWTSHKERDFPIGTKSSSSLKLVEEIDKHSNGGSSLASKLVDVSSKIVEPSSNGHPLGDQKDSTTQMDNVDATPSDNKHLDTVEKLKKRSERFKLPMPSEKEAMVIKKIESEPLPSAPTESRPDSDVKPERPARKRRWISS